jgi:hypothetical protein
MSLPTEQFYTKLFFYNTVVLAGTSQTAVQGVCGNYQQPLAQYSKSYVCLGSPCTLYLDTGWSSISYRFQHLNSAGIVIAASDFAAIPQH